MGYGKFKKKEKPQELSFSLTSKTFDRCLEMYLDARLQLRFAPIASALPVVEAVHSKKWFGADPETVTRPRPVNRFLLVEYVTDFENAVNCAIGARHSGFVHVLRHRLGLIEEPLRESEFQRIAHQVGTVCFRRQLEPYHYFRRVRK